MVPYSKNRPQYAFLVLFLTGLALLVWAVGGTGWLLVFLIGLPFSTMAFTRHHRRRTP